MEEIERNLPIHTHYSNPFTENEINEVIKQLKIRKAAGPDEIFPEFIKHLGKSGRLWLTEFYNDILRSSEVPYLFKTARTLAILKAGKPAEEASSYRPIALLSVCYKLLERLIYNRIYKAIDRITPTFQAGFRSKRSCCEQVLALTSMIEAGFQKGRKTFVAFVDLTAAYDTVWLEGLLLKLNRVVQCSKLTSLIKNMLTNRSIKVTVGLETSKSYKIKNGLPQGSVLAPLLFNLYTSDMPDTTSKKFGYADDLAIAVQSKSFEEGATVLTQDLEILSAYYRKWRLCPNPSKTEVCAFHLNNNLARQQLNVTFCQNRVRHNFNPKYLGVTLDRSLTYRKHLEITGQKLKARNNIIRKLTGTTWGAQAATLRTAALSLVYSTAEYCAPVWQGSRHVNKVDVHLNESMRLITGTLKPTPLPWLHVTSNIAPPELRRQEATVKEWRKIQLHDSPQNLPIQDILSNIPNTRLKSRNPIWENENVKTQDRFNISEKWMHSWRSAASNHDTIIDPVKPLSGFNLPRKEWSKLNRIRTGCTKCRHMLYKWGLADSPSCDCGAPDQTIKHVMEECPLRKYNGPIKDIMEATPSALEWIRHLDIDL